ncbi:MAG: type 3 domain protein [Cyanobacteria bacterium RYN_339]|nr:type 3 domain protein [Cyanobacteria bacterium RYN_339]
MFKHFRAAFSAVACVATLVCSTLSAQATNLYVTGTKVNIREKPSADSHVLIKVPYRKAVTFIKGPTNGWYQVKVGDTTGYLSAQLASTTAPDRKVVSKPNAPHFAHSGSGYTNVDGNWIPSPVQANSAPAGATAQCNDGTYSFSQHHRGTCSHHGGVRAWL